MILTLLSEIPTYLLVFTLILCVGAGWLLDNAMRGAGAGMIGNALLLAVGAVAGLVFAEYLGTNLRKEYLAGLSMAMCGAIWTLLLFCFIKSRIAI